MLNENEFHKLIEQQGQESKKKGWERLEGQLPIDNNEDADIINSDSTAARSNLKKLIIPFLAFSAVLIICLLIILKSSNNEDNSSIRYCSETDYTVIETHQTLKEFSEREEKNWLFFDWYSETELINDVVYKLNTTGEVICFQETIMDMNTGYIVKMNVTENRTDIDFLTEYKLIENECNINNIVVKWQDGVLSSRAMFQYNEYNYFLEIADMDTPNGILEFVEILLSY